MRQQPQHCAWLPLDIGIDKQQILAPVVMNMAAMPFLAR
jgi:hypothetical protein